MQIETTSPEKKDLSFFIPEKIVTFAAAKWTDL